MAYSVEKLNSLVSAARVDLESFKAREKDHKRSTCTKSNATLSFLIYSYLTIESTTASGGQEPKTGYVLGLGRVSTDSRSRSCTGDAHSQLFRIQTNGLIKDSCFTFSNRQPRYSSIFCSLRRIVMWPQGLCPSSLCHVPCLRIH